MALDQTAIQAVAQAAIHSADFGRRITVPPVMPSLYEQVYASILEAICGGLLRPGDRINQDDLAQSLNVSRQPVTQALTVLKTQDFVQDTGRRGLVVAPLRKGFFEALYQLRESLDPMAAKLAARHTTALARAAGLQLLQQGRAAVQDGSVAALTSADMAFHMWIYEQAGNPLLAETLKLYWHHLRRAMVAVVAPSLDRSSVWDEHEGILSAVLSGDETLAETLSQQHIQGATRRVVSTLSA
ncbi:GntR family transcriptional regulator [Rhodoferax sp.]|uniref:GntR family transcriptional regulator n=1 Tax=Rhodoferax sp. TaxID=50421 RepID=UPI0027515F21|nr:GntR family transcriptional regulator [Rhodoferax sp.]